MARLPRFTIPGQPQHVIQRGNNRQAIFRADDDYRFFLEGLSDATARYGCSVHAYVLMTNHVHLLVTPEFEQSISQMMQSVGRRYVGYFNHSYQRTGTLWEGRYRATLIDSSGYLLCCMRYIEQNPVRAGMVAHPADYPWSSYRATGEGADNFLVAPHAEYLALGVSSESRQVAYRALFASAPDGERFDTIRDATHKGWALGDERFKAEVASAGRRAEPRARGGDRKSARFRAIDCVSINGV